MEQQSNEKKSIPYRFQRSLVLYATITALLKKQIAQRAVKSKGFRKQLSDPARTDPGYRILRYQHIVSPEAIPYPILEGSFVTPESFSKQLAFLKKNCNVLLVEQIAEILRSGSKLPSRCVALTFDGGYIDQIENAAPILQEHGLKASFFVATAYIGTMNQFWKDKISLGLALLAHADANFPSLPSLPDEFREFFKMDEPRKVDPLDHALLVEVMDSLPPAERAQLIIEFGVGLGAALRGLPEFQTFMTWDDVKKLADAGHTVGSLTHSHSRLIELSSEELVADLRDSFQSLSEHGIFPSTILAAPPGPFPSESAALLAGAGFRSILLNLSSAGNSGQVIDRETYAAVQSELDLQLLFRYSISEKEGGSQQLFACNLWNYNWHWFSFNGFGNLPAFFNEPKPRMDNE